MLTWMPVWKPPPKSTGNWSGSVWAQAAAMRSREVILPSSVGPPGALTGWPEPATAAPA